MGKIFFFKEDDKSSKRNNKISSLNPGMENEIILCIENDSKNGGTAVKKNKRLKRITV